MSPIGHSLARRAKGRAGAAWLPIAALVAALGFAPQSARADGAAARLPAAASTPTRQAVDGGPAGGRTVERARALYLRGQRFSAWLQQRLVATRRAGDHEWAACLNDELSQTNATLRFAAELSQQVDAAVRDGNAAELERLVGSLRVVVRRFQEHRVAALACPGGGRVREGHTTVQVVRDSGRRQTRTSRSTRARSLRGATNGAQASRERR